MRKISHCGSRSPKYVELRPRLHGSGQIFARAKTCTVPPCVYTGPAELDDLIFERLRPRLHGSGQIFARTKTCTVPPQLRLHGTGGTGRIFERLRPRLHGSGQVLHGRILFLDRLFTWIRANSVAVVFTRIRAKFRPVAAFDSGP